MTGESMLKLLDLYFFTFFTHLYNYSCGVSKSRVYFRLSKSPDSEKTIPALLKILQLKPSDLPPIRFFTTGFRQTMLRMHLWQKIS